MLLHSHRRFGLLLSIWFALVVVMVGARPAVGAVDQVLSIYERNQTLAREEYGKPLGRCGDGVVDDGEECDCGDREECKLGKNTCCDYKTCKFVKEAVCDSTDPLQGCCQDCQLKPAKTVCRASKSDFCDPVEEVCTGTSSSCPKDEHTPNGTPCGDGLKCASGFCTSQDDYCRTEVPKLRINNREMVKNTLIFNKRPIELYGVCEDRELFNDGEDADCSWTRACGAQYADGTKEKLEGRCYEPSTMAIDPSIYFFPNGTTCNSQQYGQGICVEGACLRWKNFNGKMRYETPEEHVRRLAKESTYPSTVKMDVILGATLGSLGGLIFVVAVVWVWCSGRGVGLDDNASEETRYTVEEIVEVRPARGSVIIEKSIPGTITATTTELESTMERSNHNRVKVTAVDVDEDGNGDGDGGKDNGGSSA